MSDAMIEALEDYMAIDLFVISEKLDIETGNPSSNIYF